MAGNMAGTGPYKFVVWNRNENLQLEVNDDYWGDNAKLDVRIEIGGDPDVRVLGLRAGSSTPSRPTPLSWPTLKALTA